MSDYTKEQEREALEAVEGGLSGRKLPIDLDAVRVVFAMAKRTAGVEMKLAACRAGSERWHAVALESQQERDALRTQIATVTRERDDLADERRLVALELGCGLRVPLPGRLADVTAHLVAQVRIGEARLTRERDEARADASRLREALTQVRDAMRATGQEPDGDDDPRRPVASAVWHALASTPSAEPTRTDAERWLGDGPEVPGGTLAFHAAPSAEPTPRDMRVAEALLAHFTSAFTALFGEQATKDIRSTIDLRAIAAEAVKP